MCVDRLRYVASCLALAAITACHRNAGVTSAPGARAYVPTSPPSPSPSPSPRIAVADAGAAGSLAPLPVASSDQSTLPARSRQTARVAGPCAPEIYSVAGVSDANAFEAFLKQLQTWVAVVDKQSIAAATTFPIRTPHDGKILEVDANDFLAHYDAIMTAKVRDAIAKQKPCTSFANWQGVMIGNGDVWFIPTPKGFTILTVNE